MSYCDDCIHKPVCYRTDSVSSSYADKCGDFAFEKTGHWILQPSNKEQGERDFIWWKCSECGQVIYSETEQDRRKYHAYCGMCGCKMKEVEE